MATFFTNDMEFEIQFRDILFQMYAKKEKYLIPREVYNRTIEDMKLASQDSSSKPRHFYYVLGKYEIMQCGDVEKLVKKRENPTDPPQ